MGCPVRFLDLGPDEGPTVGSVAIARGESTTLHGLSSILLQGTGWQPVTSVRLRTESDVRLQNVKQTLTSAGYGKLPALTNDSGTSAAPNSKMQTAPQCMPVAMEMVSETTSPIGL
jgi:hypothetical protein